MAPSREGTPRGLIKVRERNSDVWKVSSLLDVSPLCGDTEGGGSGGTVSWTTSNGDEMSKW